jgi:hypothetical protein
MKLVQMSVLLGHVPLSNYRPSDDFLQEIKLPEYEVKLLIFYVYNIRRFMKIQVKHSESPISDQVAYLMLLHIIQESLDLNSLSTSYKEIQLKERISKYFSIGFLLCSQFDQVQYIIPKFLHQDCKFCWKLSVPYPSEIDEYVKENENIIELIAERFMLQKLLE